MTWYQFCLVVLVAAAVAAWYRTLWGSSQTVTDTVWPLARKNMEGQALGNETMFGIYI